MSFRPGHSEQTRSRRKPNAQTEGENDSQQGQTGDANDIAKAIDRAGLVGVSAIAIAMTSHLDCMSERMR